MPEPLLNWIHTYRPQIINNSRSRPNKYRFRSPDDSLRNDNIYKIVIIIITILLLYWELNNCLAGERLKILDVNPFSVQRVIPLKEEMTLTVNREVLLELIEGTSYLSQKLHSIGVLSRRQKEYISGQPGDIKRNEVLLEILNRRTIGDYEETICCLRSSGQKHVADILEGGGKFIWANHRPVFRLLYRCSSILSNRTYFRDWFQLTHSCTYTLTKALRKLFFFWIASPIIIGHISVHFTVVSGLV